MGAALILFKIGIQNSSAKIDFKISYADAVKTILLVPFFSNLICRCGVRRSFPRSLCVILKCDSPVGRKQVSIANIPFSVK